MLWYYNKDKWIIENIANVVQYLKSELKALNSYWSVEMASTNFIVEGVNSYDSKNKKTKNKDEIILIHFFFFNMSL